MAITEYVNPAIGRDRDIRIRSAINGGFSVEARPEHAGMAEQPVFAASSAEDLLAMLALFYGVTPSEIAAALDALERRLPKKRIYAAAAVVSDDARIKDRPE